MRELLGFLNINKPQGITSHDVVDIIRKTLNISKVGHTGTLDPVASGVLVLAIGKATRLIEYIVEGRKEYIATLKLGYSSNTYDIDGEVKELEYNKITKNDFSKALPNFIGKTQQTPPQFSAIKIKGKPAYKLARKGNNISIPKRTVYIQDIKLINYSNPYAKIEVKCQKGTYIRSLIHDIGTYLGTDAILTDLQRTYNSGFHIQNSISLDNLTPDILLRNLISPFDIFKKDSLIIDNDIIPRIKWGGKIILNSNKKNLFLFDKNKSLVCIAVKDGEFYHPHKVFIS